MKKLRYLLAGCSLLFAYSASAQIPLQIPHSGQAYYQKSAGLSISLNSGQPDALKGIHSVNIIYDYSELGVDLFRKEQDFLRKAKDDFKNDSAGFNLFKENWFSGRQKNLEPAFEKTFNKEGKKCNLNGTNYSTDKDITLKVTTTFIMTGINGKKKTGCASIDAELTFTDSHGKEIARYFVKNGRTSEIEISKMDPTLQIKRCYEKTAKALLKELKKELK